MNISTTGPTIPFSLDLACEIGERIPDPLGGDYAH